MCMCVCERERERQNSVSMLKDLFELMCLIQTVVIILLDQVYSKSLHITLINTCL